MSKSLYNFSRAVLSSQTKDSPEMESHFRLVKQSEAAEQRLNLNFGLSAPYQSSFRMPWDAFTRDLTVGSGSSAGQYLIGTSVSKVQEALRPTSLAAKLPVVWVDNCHDITTLPRISSGDSSSQLSETASVSESDETFGSAGATPVRLSACVQFSKQLLKQAVNNPGLDAVLVNDLRKAIGQQVDSLILTGTGASGMTGLLYQPSLANSFTFSAAPTQAAVLSAQKSLEAAYVDVERMRWLLGPGTAYLWRQTARGSSNTAFFLLQNGLVNGEVPAYVSTQIGTTEQAVLADFSEMAVLVYGAGIDVVYDPFTLATSGEVRITASIYFNYVLRRPTVFAVSTDAGNQ
jgi:HK97 family phage major capsid protein